MKPILCTFLYKIYHSFVESRDGMEKLILEMVTDHPLILRRDFSVVVKIHII